MFINKDSLIYSIISIFISAGFIFISDTIFYEKVLHQVFNIGHVLPSFLDFRCYQAIVPTVEAGLNPYIENPFDPFARPFNLPFIWFYIARFINLENEIIFNFVIFLFIFFYCYSVFMITNLVNTNKKMFLAILLIISTSSMLLIERGNTDMIIFFLIFCSVFNSNFIKSSVFIFLATILKVYPIFTFFINFKDMKFFLLSITIALAAFLTFFGELTFFYSNTSSGNDTSFVFGLGAISNAILKGLDRIEFNLLESFILTSSHIHIFLILCVFILIIVFYLLNKKIYSTINFNDNENRLFLAGASIYCGSFIFFTSYDYRLVFLIFTIPYFFNKLNKYYSIYIISLYLSMNSLILFSIAEKPMNYLFIGMFIHFLKFLVFLVLTYELTKFINLFFKNLKINH